MARDPAQGVITWFAVLMVALLFAAIACIGAVVWGLWHLAASLAGH